MTAGVTTEIGIDSFAAVQRDPETGRAIGPAERIANLLEEVEAADRAGLDVFGIGEHHRADFLDSAPAVLLAAAAARTSRIRLASAVTVLTAADPVRVFQEFATVDLVSGGRVDLVVGRGSFAEAFPLFGYDKADYEALFVEKLDLLLRLREANAIRWSGRFRPALRGEGVFPRPHQAMLPVWVGVGATPASFARAGTLGLPLMVAIIGGSFARFRPLVDLYRAAWREAGHAAGGARVGVHAFGFVAGTDAAARDTFFPGWHAMFSKVGEERGWAPPTRAQFDALCGPGGAFLIGGPDHVARKVREASEALGGVDRITFQMSSPLMAHARMIEAIGLLGSAVAPLVRNRT